MYMSFIDWLIVSVVIASICLVAYATKKYTQSVADFLAAGRCAGRYLLTMSEGMAGLGAVSIIAMLEMYYEAGFVAQWWQFMVAPIGLFIAVSGWVIYRFRQTRALTIAQFFEIRYSRRFRVFAGILSWIAGVINFGIFPAVGSRFFVHFCGFPQTTMISGIAVPTFAIIMFILLSLSLYFTFVGGQVTVMITDFFQGLLMNVVVVIILIYLLFVRFDWQQIIDSLMLAQESKSMLNPLDTGSIKNYNVSYFLILGFATFYQTMAWQGSQAYNCSAKNPHEAKMGKVLGVWRKQAQVLMFVMIPVCAYCFLHSSIFSSEAVGALDHLAGIKSDYLRSQLTVTVALAHILPKGLVGAFAAVMYVAFISTHDSYLHSWGSIFVQDVVLPLRKKPISPKQHMKYLRFSIFFVAAFIFVFSLLYPQTQDVYMFFAITGATYVGGAGIVIIGGLYWNRGTTAAAWSAMITGSILGFSGIVLKKLYPSLPNGQKIFFITILTSTCVYVLVSLLGKRKVFDLDKMLHRDETLPEVKKLRIKGLWHRLGVTDEFSLGDKIIFFASISFGLGWFLVWVVGTILGIVFKLDAEAWAKFWHFKVWFTLVLGIGTTIWISLGGIRDMKDMFKTLSSMKRDVSDNGIVESASVEETVSKNEI